MKDILSIMKIIVFIGSLMVVSSMFSQIDSLEVDSTKYRIEEPLPIVEKAQDTVVHQPNKTPKSKKENKNKGFDLKNLTFGGNIGASFGDNTYISLAPRIGYYFTKTTVVGTQFIYRYTSQKVNGLSEDLSGHSYGTGLWARQYVLSKFFLHAEWEALNWPSFTVINSEVSESKKWTNSVMLGGGYYKRISKHGGVGFSLLYIVNYDENGSAYDSPLIVRIGAFF